MSQEPGKPKSIFKKIAIVLGILIGIFLMAVIAFGFYIYVHKPPDSAKKDLRAGITLLNQIITSACGDKKILTEEYLNSKLAEAMPSKIGSKMQVKIFGVETSACTYKIEIGGMWQKEGKPWPHNVRVVMPLQGDDKKYSDQ